MGIQLLERRAKAKALKRTHERYVEVYTRLKLNLESVENEDFVYIQSILQRPDDSDVRRLEELFAVAHSASIHMRESIVDDSLYKDVQDGSALFNDVKEAAIADCQERLAMRIPQIKFR